MQIVVLTERCRDYKVRSGRVKEHAANESDLARLLGEVNVCNEARKYWLVLIDILEFDEPSMSEGLSRSMRNIRPVERAKMRTLLAT